LILVVTIKYVAVIMRADNRGEGGLLAGFTHQRSKVERYAKSGNFRASSALRKAGRVARIGGTGATTPDLSRLTRYGRRSGVREPAGG
jgi:K+ transporter